MSIANRTSLSPFQSELSDSLPHYIKLSLYMKIKEITLGGKKEGQAMQSK
jgi:hypothetical protein